MISVPKTKTLFFFVMVSFLMVNEGIKAHQIKRQPKLVLTNKFDGLEPVAEFSCSETIHGYITLPKRAVGKHTLEGKWINPNGIEEENFKNDIEFLPPGRQTAYVWLEFQDKSGGTLGDFRSRGDETDLNKPHNGEWQVKVLWNGQPLVESKFRVKCS
ncbi:MAG: hypothetical protein ACKVQC_07235 [Elusimicrobiota bacterium]